MPEPSKLSIQVALDIFFFLGLPILHSQNRQSYWSRVIRILRPVVFDPWSDNVKQRAVYSELVGNEYGESPMSGLVIAADLDGFYIGQFRVNQTPSGFVP